MIFLQKKLQKLKNSILLKNLKVIKKKQTIYSNNQIKIKKYSRKLGFKKIIHNNFY